MKEYIKKIFNSIIHGSVKKKILTSVLVLLYLFIVLICVIPVQVSSTSPGSITPVSNVIEIENADTSYRKRIYTVSVYSKTKASILEYLIAKLDKNTDIEIDKREDTIYTVNEENKIDVIAKDQSIQDAIITAYSTALSNGYDVNLDYTYKGIRVACVPVNYLKTGPESLQIGDIITEINSVKIDNLEQFKEFLKDIRLQCDENKEIKTVPVKVLRDNNELLLDKCNINGLLILEAYLKVYDDNPPEYIFYEYYNIDTTTAKPKFSINKAYSSGPSGGLIQTLYVYETITNNSLVKDKYVLGTGTISRNGKVGAIGGVCQKVLTANYYGCDYFLVPAENYDEALTQYNKIKDPSYKLIKITSFNDAIDALKEVNE